jgi:aminopeptidase N
MRRKFLFFFLLLAPFTYAQDVDVLHYQFALDLNDDNDTVVGKAEIKFINKTAGTVQLDLVQTGNDGKGMQVLRVERDNHTESYPFSHENNKIILPVIKGTPGDTLLFRIFYKGIPKDGLIISKNKFGERTFFADNWPNRARHWIPCIDRPDDKASFEFMVTAPAPYTVVANGWKKEEKILANGKKYTYWKEAIALPTKVMAIGAARFATKTFADSPENLPVSAWVYPRDSAKGFYDYALAPQILTFFSAYIAPFPFSKLANVQSTTIFGGMENASCIFYAENSITGDRGSEALMAHEIAHQWFGNAASEKSFAHLWLSEGFATYLTHLYFEKHYGKEVLKERLQEDRRLVIDHARTTSRPVVDSTEDLMSLLNANSYQKGGWVLHMLRQEVGDSAFRKIIQTYYHQYKESNAETKDFQAVAEKVSGKDLKWFFDQWLYRPGIPKLMVQKVKEGDTQRLKIVQKGPVYRLPLTIHIAGDSGRLVKESLLLTGRETESTWRGKASASVDVLLDPDNTLLFEEVKK